MSTKLTDNEKDCVVWSVLSGATRSESFAIFCKPELRGSRAILDKLAAQFFASSEVVQYVAAYKETLKAALEPAPAAEKKFSPEQMKQRKEEALYKLMNYVVEESMNIENNENKDDIIKYADKLGLLDSEEVAVEAPRRYLPETCSNCRYKSFVEGNCIEE